MFNFASEILQRPLDPFFKTYFGFPSKLITKGRVIADKISHIDRFSVFRKRNHLIITTFLAKNSIDRVDLMKIDIEGSEFDLLTGAKSSLENGKVKAMYIEINSSALNDHNRFPSQIFKLLEKYNYELFYPHANGRTETEMLILNGKKLCLSKLDKDDIINESINSYTLLDILAIHTSIIKN